MDINHNLGRNLPTGEKHYRAFVGNANNYDVVGAEQFNMLTTFGLREENSILDIGCGSLRVGRLLIPYLLAGRYFGVEPEGWLVEEGLNVNVGAELAQSRQPQFLYTAEFEFGRFKREFDFLLAFSILSHTSLNQLKQCISNAAKVMHDESIFFATFREGDTDYEQDAWAYPEVISFRYDTVKEVSRSFGLNIHRVNWPTHNRQIWIALTKKERPEVDFDGIKKKQAAIGSH